ncbi:MAG: MFS transporter [Bacteroidales bacterium]
MLPIPKKQLTLFAVILISFFNPFMGAAVNIALPAISTEFQMSAVALSWVAMAFLLSSAVFQLPAGKLADLTGRHRIFTLGVVIMSGGSLLCTLAPSATWLLIFRFLQGTGGALVFGTGMALLTSAFPPQERGKVLGYNVAVVYLGLSAAPVLGGVLTQYFGWRSLFYINAAAGVIVTATMLSALWHGKPEERRNEPFDLIGTFLYVASLSALMLGLSMIPQFSGILFSAAGVGGLLLFANYEQRKPFPVFHMQLFLGNRVFAFSNLSALINYAATFGVTFLLSLYLQQIRMLTPGEAGMVLVAQPVVMTLSSLLSGRLSDHFDARVLASGGMALSTLGLLLFVFLSSDASHLFIVTGLIILGLGFGLFSAPNTHAVMSAVDKENLGTASATIGTMRLTGQMVSMALATLTIHLFLGNQPIQAENREAFMESIRVAFFLFTLLCFGGIFASLARGPKITPTN